MSDITISNWFEFFWFLIALLLYPKSAYVLWIIIPQSQRSLPNKQVFERIFTKVFCQYILNLMSKKKLGSFNDSINTFFNRSYVCHDINIFSPASFTTFPWRCWKEFSQFRKDLRKTFCSHENIRLVTDLSGVNIGFY